MQDLSSDDHEFLTYYQILFNPVSARERSALDRLGADFSGRFVTVVVARTRSAICRPAASSESNPRQTGCAKLASPAPTRWRSFSSSRLPTDATVGRRFVTFSARSLATDQLPGGPQRVGKPVDVHESDQDSTGPAGGEQEEAVFPLAHTSLGAGEMQQREHGEGELQCQHHLAQREQFGDTVVAAQTNDQDRGENGEGARDQPAHPGLDPPVHEAFHHYLTGEGSGDGAALTRSQKSYGEESARDRKSTRLNSSHEIPSRMPSSA